MSADSGRRGGLGPNQQQQHHRPGQIVSPQPVSDKSIIDSVAGIINDIVPQAYASGGPSSDNREAIAWAKFEWADINDQSFFAETCNYEGSSVPPLLLALGYANGVQLWLVSASGEASEVLSWRSAPVRCLRVLPSPRCSPRSINRGTNGRTDEDPYRAKRPLVALCEGGGPQPHYHAVSFVSLRTGETVKSIRFKSPVSEVLANKRSVVVTFAERIAVFDARNLEDVLSVTTCYLQSPGSSLNPVALASRWLAYCERRLLPAQRSSGGCEAEGVSSYTATVLYAAKSLGKGLRGLGETVASSIAGAAGHHTHHQHSPPNSANCVTNAGGDRSNAADASQQHQQPGLVSVLDLEAGADRPSLLAHFAAHSEAVVAMCFDATGALLMTADRRGHDFHVFRLQPHPGGSSLAAVHHLYVLHRGDTSAKVQDMAFSADARWAVVSTSRGTSHVFPVAPYGGPLGVRTHSSPHVVNRLSRFQRSAGLGDDTSARSHSPVAHCHEVSGPGPTSSSCSSASSVSAALANCSSSSSSPFSGSSPAGGSSCATGPYGNPRLPPYPHPTVVHPLAQIRQPAASLQMGAAQPGLPRLQQARARPHQQQDPSLDSSASGQLKLCACFAPPRAWINAQRDLAASSNKLAKRPVDSLFILACHGNLVQYDLEPRSASGVPREKVCDDTPIELEVEAKGQWPLMRTTTSPDINVPLSPDSPLLEIPLGAGNGSGKSLDEAETNGNETRWLSQVEIFTHAGPHRRLWMGPQFVFKTYNAPSGVAANLVEAETVEVGAVGGSRPARSNPVNMPHATPATASRPLMPVVIDGSGSSYEQSPRFVDTYGDALDRYDNSCGSGENQLREDLAEAMLETSAAPHRSTGRRLVVERVGGPVAKVVNPLGTVITVSAEGESTAAPPSVQQRRRRRRQGQQADLESSTTSSSSASIKSESVCAEEGRWPGCGCGFGEEQEASAEAVREHTEICAEMRPTREVAAIDNVPPESIEEVRELRTLCAEELSSARSEEPDEEPHAWSCPPSSSSSSSDEDIEHVPPAPLVLKQQQQQQQHQQSPPREELLPDMVEIIDIDAMQRALGEPAEEAVTVVLKPTQLKNRRGNKAQQRAKSILLEANKENLEDQASDSEPVLAAQQQQQQQVLERSVSSDGANALMMLLPMDTGEAVEEVEPEDKATSRTVEPPVVSSSEAIVREASPALPLLPSLSAGGNQSTASCEDLSSSSFSSASRASLDARSSPTASYSAEHMMVFPGDSSGSL